MTPPEQRRIRAVFFDAGFTLIYPDPPVPQRCAAIARDHGPEITPWLLARIATLTDGASVRANTALITNNAGVAGRLARTLVEGSKMAPDSIAAGSARR